MVKKTADEYFRENRNEIEKICSIYSRYFGLNYEDLLSLSHESFMKSYEKYKYDKVEFKKFMLYNLINDIKTYFRHEKYKEMKENLYILYKKSEFLSENESFYIKKYKNNNINISEKVENLISKIIDFCLLPNVHEILAPFYKNKIYENKRIPIYAIQKYFIYKENYTYSQIQEAFSNIRLLLKKELI